MPDTQYTDGFRNGRAYEQDRIIRLLESKITTPVTSITSHWASGSIAPIRNKTLIRAVELIKESTND
jgi:hypothetical protein